MNKFSESNGILGEFNANLSSFGVNLSNQILSLPCGMGLKGWVYANKFF